MAGYRMGTAVAFYRPQVDVVLTEFVVDSARSASCASTNFRMSSV
jgi:hypothetical protein